MGCADPIPGQLSQTFSQGEGWVSEFLKTPKMTITHGKGRKSLK